MTVPTPLRTRPDAAPAESAPMEAAGANDVPQRLDPGMERRLVNERLFQGVVDATPRTLMLGLFAALTLAVAATWGAGDDEAGVRHRRMVWAWVGLVAIVLAHGLLTSLAVRKADPAEGLPASLTLQYTWGSHACAVLWGAAGWVLLPAPAPWATVVILAGMSMVLLGAAAAMAGYRPLVTIHVSLIASVFSAGLLRSSQPEFTVCGLGFLLLAATAIFSAHRQEAALSSAIAGQLRIASLLDRLQVEQCESEAARQEAVLAREEAERAHAAKTVFMAAASHDLRQPMHAVTQYLAVIARLNLDPKLDASIAGASQAVDAMGKLLQAVLEISKLMSGAVAPKPDVFSLDDLGTRRQSHFEPLAVAKGLVLDTGIEPNLLVRTDRALLDRVLGNLLHNAITYTARGRVVVRIGRRGGLVRIRIADTGQGIAVEERQRIFEPFYQLANPGRNRQLGFGLGLAIVREHVRLLGLGLRLTSRVGRGSVFTVTLPVCPDRRRFTRLPASADDPASERNHIADALIVLIDDDDMSLRATETTLHAFGCRVAAGHDAAEAVEALRAAAACPSAIVSDYRLEGATGLEAVACIREHCCRTFGSAARLAVLIVSGETSPEELAKVHASGAVMLHKPVRPAVLFKHLNAALHRHAHDLDGQDGGSLKRESAHATDLLHARNV